MKIAVLVIILLAAAGAGAYFFLFKAPEEEKPGPAGPAAAAPRKLTHAEKEKIARQKLTQLRAMAERDRDNLLGMKALHDQIGQMFKGSPNSITFKAQQAYAKAEINFLARAKKAFEELKARVKGKFDTLQKESSEAVDDRRDQYERLLGECDDYPSQFLSTEYAAGIPKLREPIQKAIDAANAYETLREEAVRLGFDGRYEAAIAKLNEYPERFRKSEWESWRQAKIEGFTEKLTAKKLEKRKEEELTYYDLYHGQSLEEADWEGDGSWELKDGVLIGTCGNERDASFSYNYGKDWEDIVLLIHMRIVRGSVTLGVRGTETSPDSGNFRFDPIRLSVGEMDANKWYILTVKLRGENYTVTGDPELLRLVEERAKKSRGPASFFLNENTEIHIKSVRIAFFDRIPASFAIEAAKQQKDGRAKKLSEDEEEEEKEGE
jgi:hypothetical protein